MDERTFTGTNGHCKSTSLHVTEQEFACCFHVFVEYILESAKIDPLYVAQMANKEVSKLGVKSVFYKYILAKTVHTKIRNFGPIDSGFSNGCTLLIFQRILKIFNVLKTNTNPQLLLFDNFFVRSNFGA